MHPLYVDLRERLSQLNTCAQENISGNRVVKAFAREDYEIKKFDEKNTDYKKPTPGLPAVAEVQPLHRHPVPGPVHRGAAGGGRVPHLRPDHHRHLHPVQLVDLDPDQPHAHAGHAPQRPAALLRQRNKIIELYYAKSTITSRPDAKPVKTRLQGAVDFEDVSLKLHGSQVLSHIDLHIQPGETVAIMGPTGSGKTSLVSLIPRFSDVSSGSLTIDGTPVRLYDLKACGSPSAIATQTCSCSPTP